MLCHTLQISVSRGGAFAQNVNNADSFPTPYLTYLCAMKAILVFGAFMLFLFSCTTSHAQVVRSKDGVNLGDRKEFIDACVQGAKTATINLNGVEMNATSYCSCVCDMILPRIMASDLFEAKSQADILKVFFQGDNFDLLMTCIGGNVSVTEDFNYGQMEDNAFARSIAVQTCAEAMKRELGSTYGASDAMAERYCECMMHELAMRNIRYTDIDSLVASKDSTMRAVTMKCMNQALNPLIEEAPLPSIDGEMDFNQLEMLPEDVLAYNQYEPEDIVGKKSSCKVYLQSQEKLWYLELSIEGVSANFLFDTGAADLILSRSFYSDLLALGKIDAKSYKGHQHYEMANGEFIFCDMVELNHVQVGDYIVNNVLAAVMDEGGMLCGMSFFSKFKDWEWQPNKGVITLYR
jgi:clan AA aspartic protease (TIGR02281 family)